MDDISARGVSLFFVQRFLPLATQNQCVAVVDLIFFKNNNLLQNSRACGPEGARNLSETAATEDSSVVVVLSLNCSLETLGYKKPVGPQHFTELHPRFLSYIQHRYCKTLLLSQVK